MSAGDAESIGANLRVRDSGANRRKDSRWSVSTKIIRKLVRGNNVRRLSTVILVAVGIVVSAIAATLVHRPEFAELVRPPTPSFSIAGSPVDSHASIEGTILNLDVRIQRADRSVSAVLYLQGAEVETIQFKTAKVSFGALLLPTGPSKVAIEIRRHFGPFTNRRWYTIDINATPTKLDRVEVNVPAVVWSGELQISGKAIPNSLVSILLDGQTVPVLADGNDAADVWADGDGRFAARVRLAMPGKYRVQATIEADGRVARPLSSEEAIVEFRAELPQILSRKLILTIGSDGFSWGLQATMESDDPRVKALIEGKASLETFVGAVHGLILFNQSRYVSELGNFRLQSQAGRIWIAVNTKPLPYSPIQNGRIHVQRSGGASLPAGKDAIEIRANGPRIIGFVPKPESAKDNVVTWTGGDVSGVVAFVSVPPRQQSLGALALQDVLPNDLVGLGLDMVAVIPILWLLHIFRLGFGAELDASHQHRLRHDAFLLGTLVFFQSTHYLLERLSWSVQRAIRPYDFVFRDLTDLRLEATAGIVVAYVGIVVTCLVALLPIKLLLKNHPGSHAIRNLLFILLVAFTVGFLFALPVQVLMMFSHLDVATASDLAIAFRFSTAGVCFVIGFTVVRRLWRTAIIVSGRSFLVHPTFYFGGLILLVGVALPHGRGFDPFNDNFFDLFSDSSLHIREFINRLGSLSPIAMSLLACAALTHSARHPSLAVSQVLRIMLFSSILAGTSPAWIIFPVPLLLAMVLFAPVVLMPRAQAQLLSENRRDILANRELLLRRAYEHARQYAPSGGLFGVKPFGAKQGDSVVGKEFTPLTVEMPNGSRLRATELVFAFGPHGNAGADALLAVRVGSWGAAFFVLLYALPTFVQAPDHESFPYLAAMTRVVSVGGYWLIGAFFLGYFYESIRGSAGWEKGAWIALGISLANEPMAILAASSVADFAAIGIAVAQRFAFFIFVGLGAFDRLLFREIIGGKIEWRMFPFISGLSVLSAFASLAIAGIGVAISSAFTGQLTTVLGQVAGALLPAVTSAPAVAQ